MIDFPLPKRVAVQFQGLQLREGGTGQILNNKPVVIGDPCLRAESGQFLDCMPAKKLRFGVLVGNGPQDIPHDPSAEG